MNEKLAMNGSINGAQDLTAFQGGAEKLVQLKPKLLAMIDAEVRMFNLSVPSTLSSAIRIWQSYQADKERFKETFTSAGFDAEALADFPVRTAVLWYTDVQLGQALNPKIGMPEEILSAAKPLHARMARAAQYLWEADEVLGPVVADIRLGAGYLDMAGDLTRYAVLFEDHWNETTGRCDITLEDIASAKNLSTAMLEALTAAPVGTVAELKELRARAGEYLRRGAAELRAAAEYVFRKDPVALVRYPSLHVSRGPGRSRPNTDPADESVTDGTDTEIQPTL